MFQYKNWILPTVPHGITDIIDSPEKTLAVYSTIGPFILNMNDENKQIILLISSIYHMRKDVPFGILGSAYMHDIWLKQPEIAVLFLSFIHTPRHYMRSFKYKKKEKIISIFLFSIIMLISLLYNVDTQLIENFGEYWWISPAVCHIVVHETNNSTL